MEPEPQLFALTGLNFGSGFRAGSNIKWNTMLGLTLKMQDFGQIFLCKKLPNMVWIRHQKRNLYKDGTGNAINRHGPTTLPPAKAVQFFCGGRGVGFFL